MKKFLPILIFLIFPVFLVLFSPHAFAQTVVAPPADGTWVADSEVTFVGKNAARSAEFLRWTLQNYDWLVAKTGTNPLVAFWIIIRNIVYAFSTLFVLVTAFSLILTRGKNMTIVRFVPRFMAIILLVTFSFALIQFTYQITDVVQAFFLRADPVSTCPPKCISDAQLLSVGFDYSSFTGLRKYGISFDESAFITLLLAKLTAVTYYAMSGILILRKVILWFFVILSPIFPILLLYSPLRNSAKIWLGEFFRWVLYAPLFAVLLAGLVSLWKSSNGIPLPFSFGGSSPYPTAVNILLGGPGQSVSATNSLNSPDTFALYVVALIMLWVVILLPFLLLQIFLNYIGKISVNQTTSQIFSKGANLFSPPALPSLPVAPAAIAKPIPIAAKFTAQIPAFKSQSFETPSSVTQTISNYSNISNAANLSRGVNSEILNLTNLSLPTIKDVARYETKIMSKDIRQHEEVANIRESLQKIANPSAIGDTTEKLRYTQIREKLIKESGGGNPLASAILNASVNVTSATSRETEGLRLEKIINKISKPELIQSPIERRQFTQLKQQVEAESMAGSDIAGEILRIEKGTPGAQDVNRVVSMLKQAKEKGDQLAISILNFLESKTESSDLPAVNKVQSVSIEDYEAVKKIWKENYQTMEVPHKVGSETPDKKEWINQDVEKIDNTLNLLSSLDPERVSEGMKQVSGILPFFLVGGFSKTEIIAYLKAKKEAAKTVLSEMQAQESGENQEFVDRSTASASKPKELEQEVDSGLTGQKP